MISVIFATSFERKRFESNYIQSSVIMVHSKGLWPLIERGATTSQYFDKNIYFVCLYLFLNLFSMEYFNHYCREEGKILSITHSNFAFFPLLFSVSERILNQGSTFSPRVKRRKLTRKLKITIRWNQNFPFWGNKIFWLFFFCYYCQIQLK